MLVDLIYDKLIANRKLMRISPKFYSVNLIYKARQKKLSDEIEEHTEYFLIQKKTHRSAFLCIFIAKNMLSITSLFRNWLSFSQIVEDLS